MLKFPLNYLAAKHSKIDYVKRRAKKHGLSPKRKKIGALRRLFLLVFIMLIGFPLCQARTGIIGGINSTDWNRFVNFGAMQSATGNLFIFGSSDFGGGEVNAHFGGLYLLPASKMFSIGFLLGPDFTILREATQTDQTITYAGAATGIVLSFTYSKKIHLWIASTLNNIEQSNNQQKYGIGFTLYAGED